VGLEGLEDSTHPKSFGREPTPLEAAELTETVEQLLAAMSEEDRPVLELSLQSYSTREISEQPGQAAPPGRTAPRHPCRGSRVPGPQAARAGRHGPGLQGQTKEPRSARRPEVPPGGVRNDPSGPQRAHDRRGRAAE
jgi:hypothetical protein